MKLKTILWCNEDTHDKVWGILENDLHYYVYWGRRDAKLQFKYHGKSSAGFLIYIKSKLEKLKTQKLNKGYNEIDQLQLFTLFPDFEDTVEQYLLVATLEGKIR